jgi:hypothetical protein
MPATRRLGGAGAGASISANSSSLANVLSTWGYREARSVIVSVK